MHYLPKHQKSAVLAALTHLLQDQGYRDAAMEAGSLDDLEAAVSTIAAMREEPVGEVWGPLQMGFVLAGATIRADSGVEYSLDSLVGHGTPVLRSNESSGGTGKALHIGWRDVLALAQERGIDDWDPEHSFRALLGESTKPFAYGNSARAAQSNAQARLLRLDDDGQLHGWESAEAAMAAVTVLPPRSQEKEAADQT